MAAEVKLEPHQLSVVVFLASVRPNRMAERVKKFLSVAISAKAMSPIFFGEYLDQFLFYSFVLEIPNVKIIKTFCRPVGNGLQNREGSDSFHAQTKRRT